MNALLMSQPCYDNLTDFQMTIVIQRWPLADACQITCYIMIHSIILLQQAYVDALSLFEQKGIYAFPTPPPH